MAPKIYSFDVFDTCITRPYLEPTDLFQDLARSTILRAGHENSQTLVDHLYKARIDAEILARRKHAELADISLDQIYACLLGLLELQVDIPFMKSTEIALELEHCSPVYSVLQEVTKFRNLGKIVYISDMYLSSDVIQQMLSKCGFWQEGDALYVSNEVGKSKHHGSLFQHVAITEGVSPRDIRHIGDNKRADLRMAKAAGVDATLFTGSQLTTYEKAVIAKFHHPAVRNFIGLNRRVRLSAEQVGDPLQTPPPAVVHSVIAPLLIVFVAWVLYRARKDGKRRLYFVSRDAEIFYKIAKILMPGDDVIECRYLYGSRKAWFAPSIQRCDREEIKWAYHPTMARTPKAILRRLDLEPQDVISVLAEAGFPDIDEELDSSRTNELVALIENSELKKAVLAQATLNREKVLAYLEQEGLFDGTPCSLVDIGWVLNCQTALRYLLKSADPTQEIHGYYFGVGKNHNPERIAGRFSSYFSHSLAEHSGEYCDNRIFHLPSVNVIEHLFTPATHGTVVGYQSLSSWEPITSDSAADSPYQHWVRALHNMVERHTLELAQSRLLQDNLEDLMPAANQLLFSFLSNPEKDDASAVGWLQVNVEQSHYKEYERKLASPLSFRDLMGIVFYDLNPRSKRYAHPDHVWLNGSVALSSSFVKLAFKALHRVKQLTSNN